MDDVRLNMKPSIGNWGICAQLQPPGKVQGLEKMYGAEGNEIMKPKGNLRDRVEKHVGRKNQETQSIESNGV